MFSHKQSNQHLICYVSSLFHLSKTRTCNFKCYINNIESNLTNQALNRKKNKMTNTTIKHFANVDHKFSILSDRKLKLEGCNMEKNYCLFGFLGRQRNFLLAFAVSKCL